LSQAATVLQLVLVFGVVGQQRRAEKRRLLNFIIGEVVDSGRARDLFRSREVTNQAADTCCRLTVFHQQPSNLVDRLSRFAVLALSPIEHVHALRLSDDCFDTVKYFSINQQWHGFSSLK
jgi:hypothetical protein